MNKPTRDYAICLRPFGVRVQNDHVLISDLVGNRLFEVNLNFNPIRTYVDCGGPHDAAYMGKDLIVADYKGGELKHYRDGELDCSHRKTPLNHLLKGPVKIVPAKDKMLVLDFKTARALWATSEGDVTFSFSSGLKKPHGACVDSEGRFYVVDNETAKLLRFDNEGVKEFPLVGIHRPTAIEQYKENLYICDQGNNRIVSVPIESPSYKPTPVWTELDMPYDFDVHQDLIYVTDTNRNLISVRDL